MHCQLQPCSICSIPSSFCPILSFLISSVLQSCYYQFGLSATRFNPCLSLSSGGVVYMCAAPTSPFLWAALYTCIVYSCQQKERVNLDRNQRCICILSGSILWILWCCGPRPSPSVRICGASWRAVFAHLCHHGLPAIRSANMPNISEYNDNRKNKKKQEKTSWQGQKSKSATDWHILTHSFCLLSIHRTQVRVPSRSQS